MLLSDTCTHSDYPIFHEDRLRLEQVGTATEGSGRDYKFCCLTRKMKAEKLSV